MRSLRTPVVLAAVAAVLGGYIWLVESRSRSTDDAAHDARRITKGFERDKVTAIDLVRGGETVTLEKQGEVWRLKKPIVFGADRATVDEMLSALEFLDAQRKIEGRDARAEYGLDKPRLVVRAHGGKALELVLGPREDAAGKSVYVAKGGESVVYVVEKRFAEQVDKKLDELRDRRALPIDRGRLTRVRAGEVRLARDGSSWRLGDGVRADAGKVNDLLKALEDLRVTRWLGGSSFSGGGLELAADDAKLQLGAACPGAPDEVLARRSGQDEAVFCLKQADLARLKADPAALRDGRVVAAKADEVKQVTVESAGKKLVLGREEGGWKLREPADRSGVPGPPGADDEAVRKWLEDLGAYHALGFVSAAPEKQGLDHSARVTLELEAGGKETLRVGEPAAGKRFARRGEEPVVLEVHAELASHLAAGADPLTFRSRRVLSFVRFDAKELEIRQGATVEVARKGESDTWKLGAPLALDADPDAVDKTLGALADLRAERFLTPPPPGSLAAARALKVTVEPPPAARIDPHAAKTDAGTGKTESHTVEVGADLPGGGCAARADGGPAFVLKKEACADLRQHLASRKLLALAEDKLTGFTLVHEGGKHAGTETAEKRGPNWFSGATQLEQSRIDGLVTILRGLTAKDAAGYGADSGHGLDHPRLFLRVRTEGQPETTLSLGAADAQGDVYVRVSGRDVTYLLPKASAESLEKAHLLGEKSASN